MWAKTRLECGGMIDIGKDLQDAFDDGYEKGKQDSWIPVREKLPQLPDGKSFMPLNATILAPSGLRNTVQMTWQLKRGKPTWCYLGETSDWNVIAWQPLPEPWKGEEYVDEPPYSEEDYEDALSKGLDLDDWSDYEKYYELGSEEDV